jgi:hypothetical protein
MVAGVSATTAAATMAPALAETEYFGSLFDKLTGASNSLFNGLQGLIGPIGGAAAAYCLIMMVVTKDQKKLESYKQWLFSIILCVVLIYAFPAIIKIAAEFGSTISNA